MILFLVNIALLSGAGLSSVLGDQPNPDIKANGGTVLVYEIDAKSLTQEYSPQNLVKALKKRIDPANRTHLTVSAIGETRFELVLPWTGKNHQQEVRRIKDLIAQTGQLEFRILANERDDKKVFEAARMYFARVIADPKRKKGIDEESARGQPPAPPASPDGKGFETELGKFTYAWMELGRTQRRSLHMDNAAEGDDKRNAKWIKAANARRKGEAILLPQLGDALLYSRECQDQRLSEDDRASKKYEYFVLCRDPEKDKAITGALVDSAHATTDVGDRPAVSLRFGARGGELMSELTAKNSSRQDRPGCFLAIILDGQILTAPRLQGAIGRDCRISGNLTQAEVDRIVTFLRAGALPVAIKPMPVTEVTVEPPPADPRKGGEPKPGAAVRLKSLRVSGNHRYLEDSGGRPFFLVGDCPQNLALKLPVAEFDGFMADCASKGFNRLWICIDGQNSGVPPANPPVDKQGNRMMMAGWDIGTLNENYFTTIDAIVKAAERHGHYCALTPLSECQWSQANIDKNVSDNWKKYGRFLGKRYKDAPNIIWQIGNDHINVKAQHAIVEGIKEFGDTHLMTVNWRPDYHKEGSGWIRKHKHGEKWIDLNAWYINAPIHENGAPCYWQKIEYERPDPMPSFQCEAAYQQPDGANASDLACRMQDYYVALGGGCGGQVYGAGWLADEWDYNSYKNNGGRVQAIFFKNLFVSRDWTTLVPDYAHKFVTEGYGTLSPTTMDYVGAAFNGGTLGIAYCPTAAPVTLDLSKFAAKVRTRWYDPTNGTFRDIAGSPFANNGLRSINPPGKNSKGDSDWVLVLETVPSQEKKETISNKSVLAPAHTDALLHIERRRPTFPVKVAEGGRYLVDQKGAPFLIAGESPQALMVNLTEKDAELFFANRVSHGFNAVWINLLCRKGTGGRADGSTHDGLLPFKSADDFAAPNEDYFDGCDRMIRLAEKHGLLVILDPCETIDHLKPMLKNGPEKCREFGRYLGSRYKEFDNLLWMHGNDFQTWKDPAHDAVVLAVAHGIKDKDTRHLHTIELDYRVSGSLDDVRWAPLIDVSAAYTYYPTYAQVLKDYNRASGKPVVMIESCYEFEQESMSAVLRRQEYWSILGGAAGQLYGNGYTWPFKPGWKDKLDTPGAIQMAYVQALFLPRAWHQLVPDQKHAVVIAGYGTFDATTTPGNVYVMTSDYVTAGRTPDGNLVIAYLPSPRTVTVDMAQLRTPATARWYDPSRGTYTTVEGSPLANTGKRKFTPPGKNGDGDGDWVLVLETKPPPEGE